jgi:hypothetical protein
MMGESESSFEVITTKIPEHFLITTISDARRTTCRVIAICVTISITAIIRMGTGTTFPVTQAISFRTILTC